MSGLWARTFGAIALAVVVTLLAVGLFSSRTIGMTFSQSDAGADARDLAFVAGRVRANPSRVQAILAESAARTSREYLLVARDTVAASAPIDFTGAPVSLRAGALQIVDLRGGARQLRLLNPPRAQVQAGTLFTGPPRRELALRSSVQRTLGAALGVAALLVLALTFLLTRSILAPVGRLTAAARRIAAGDYALTIAPSGSSELAQLARAFNAMASALERDRTLRETLVRDLAHEVRTPLANAACHLEAMEDGLVPLDPPALVALRADLTQLEHVIDGVQELAQVRVAPASLQLRAVALTELVEPPLRAVAAQAAAKGVALRSRTDPGLARADADAPRVRQVIANVVANALRHTPAGGSIEITARALDDMLEIAVSDTGEGVADADLPAIFERSFSRTGSGLGLAIARDIVRAHGGEITAESALGAGTTVRFTLPRSP